MIRTKEDYEKLYTLINKANKLYESKLNSSKKGYDAKVCSFFVNGYCSKGTNCSMYHANLLISKSFETQIVCSICREPPDVFGLLACIRKVRNTHLNPKASEKCPICKIQSVLLIPSNYLLIEDAKDIRKKQYIERLSKIDCMDFQSTPINKRDCPHRNNCLYRHINPDGSKYIFSDNMISHNLIRKKFVYVKKKSSSHNNNYVDSQNDDSVKKEKFYDPFSNLLLSNIKGSESYNGNLYDVNLNNKNKIPGMNTSSLLNVIGSGKLKKNNEDKSK